MLAQLKRGEGRFFQMYDDDKVLYYSGRFIGDADQEFAPLDDFGTPNAGATSIKYRDPQTRKMATL